MKNKKVNNHLKFYLVLSLLAILNFEILDHSLLFLNNNSSSFYVYSFLLFCITIYFPAFSLIISTFYWHWIKRDNAFKLRFRIKTRAISFLFSDLLLFLKLILFFGLYQFFILLVAPIIIEEYSPLFIKKGIFTIEELGFVMFVIVILVLLNLYFVISNIFVKAKLELNKNSLYGYRRKLRKERNQYEK